MKSILSELFNGKIYPDEQICPADPEYREVNNKISDEFEYFHKKMTEEEFNRFEELYTLHVDSSSREEEQSFIYGFKLGSMLMIEVFMGRDELVRE